MKIINTHQAKTHLSKLLEDVSRGEDIIIAKAGVPVAKLVIFIKPPQARKGGQLKGQIKIATDFDILPKEFTKFFQK